MRLIVGLGNPGRAYEKNRHNAGFLCVSALAKRWGLEFRRQRARAEVAEGDARGERVILARPQTFMNNSGDSIRALLRLANLGPADLLVVYDEMDLPFGQLRLRDKGSSGGHRGLQSIIDQLGTNEIARLRIGVGRPPPDLDPIDYVLTNFTAREAAELPAIFERAAAGIELMLDRGVAAAMNVLNQPPGRAEDAPHPLPPPPQRGEGPLERDGARDERSGRETGVSGPGSDR